ncbi:MAG: 1-deoxy-D-xylulose-5-phosphate synthase [Clostridiales bacterium]|nr:1-deoxy-D-xylulose-5-phosphate synthase [Clostridiales bacterium]
MNILDKIDVPFDIKKLNKKELEELAQTLRTQIIQTTSKNGGHLASNLGIVETTLALYYTFDFPKDKLIFDVGHQCYAHKLLSGRKDSFDTIRTGDGISGFPDRNESEFDAFGAGHAGTAISAGLGFCSARDNKGEDYFVINVVGDGAIANGLNLEALSASNSKPNKYIVILNDNGMSISKNKNGFYRFISKKTAGKGYVASKRRFVKIFGSSFITRWLISVRDFFKRLFNKSDYFEKHGFKYVGVANGNDVGELIKILKSVKYTAQHKAVFLHVKTTKGKGFDKAEEHADVYHGVGANLTCETGSFANTLGEKLNKVIENDKTVVAVTAGMKDGTGLCAVEKQNFQNFYDVGIAEEFAVTYSAGMAAGGLKPIVCVYSTFLQRAYDQIVHDVCMQNLPVIFCMDRAGFVGGDGKTHQGVFDLSYLTHVPNIKIFAPTTLKELELMIDYALELGCPCAIRYPKNAMCEREVLSVKDNPWEIIKNGDKVTLLAVGPRMLQLALDVADKIHGIFVVNARTVKPLCEKTLEQIKNTLIITLEENSVIGGFGSTVCGYYANKQIPVKVINLGVKDRFVAHGSVEEQMQKNGLTIDKITEIITNALGETNEQKD